MSKVIRQRYEVAALDDLPLTATAGYSPTLPTPPGVVPANTTGIGVLDTYISDLATGVADNYGIINLAAAGAIGALPRQTTVILYNRVQTLSQRIGLTVTNAKSNASGGTYANILVPCEVGTLIMLPAALQNATSVVSVVSLTNTIGSFVAGGANPISASLFWYK